VSKPKLLLDEHISPRTAEGCRASVDVKTAAEAGLLKADDPTIFCAAVRDGRIVVTYNNADFSILFGDILRVSEHPRRRLC
jgi:predicted nuclease of predicted toxin-antitoxin system